MNALVSTVVDYYSSCLDERFASLHTLSNNLLHNKLDCTIFFIIYICLIEVNISLPWPIFLNNIWENVFVYSVSNISFNYGLFYGRLWHWKLFKETFYFCFFSIMNRISFLKYHNFFSPHLPNFVFMVKIDNTRFCKVHFFKLTFLQDKGCFVRFGAICTI